MIETRRSLAKLLLVQNSDPIFSVLNQLLQTHFQDYLGHLHRLLKAPTHRPHALTSLHSTIAGLALLDFDCFGPVLDFFDAVVGQDLGANSDLLEPISSFFLSHKEHPHVRKWLTQNFAGFARSLVQKALSHHEISEPLKSVLQMAARPLTGLQIPVQNGNSNCFSSYMLSDDIDGDVYIIQIIGEINEYQFAPIYIC